MTDNLGTPAAAEAEAHAYEVFWVEWKQSHGIYQLPAAQLSFHAGFDAGRATEAARYRGLWEAAQGIYRAYTVRDFDGRPEGYVEIPLSALRPLVAALAENPAPAAVENDIRMLERNEGRPWGLHTARLRDEAMIERVAEALWRNDCMLIDGTPPESWSPPHTWADVLEVNKAGRRAAARAALAVIAEPSQDGI